MTKQKEIDNQKYIVRKIWKDTLLLHLVYSIRSKMSSKVHFKFLAKINICLYTLQCIYTKAHIYLFYFSVTFILFLIIKEYFHLPTSPNVHFKLPASALKLLSICLQLLENLSESSSSLSSLSLSALSAQSAFEASCCLALPHECCKCQKLN